MLQSPKRNGGKHVKTKTETQNGSVSLSEILILLDPPNFIHYFIAYGYDLIACNDSIISVTFREN